MSDDVFKELVQRRFQEISDAIGRGDINFTDEQWAQLKISTEFLGLLLRPRPITTVDELWAKACRVAGYSPRPVPEELRQAAAGKPEFDEQTANRD
jgi:hypothetical protein